MKDTYKIQILKINEIKPDFDVLWHWLKMQENGNYSITVKKITKKNAKD